jgi:uncharacterized 2Fe-2S/4Fe-4S cluster protein (DUF4445 family)
MPQTVNGQKGQTLLEAMRAVFPQADAPCGGSGRCGRCRVLVAGKPGAPLAEISAEEARLLGADRAAAGWRLACLARFTETGAVEIDREDRSFFFPRMNSKTHPDRREDGGVCAAVDIGTTTIVCVLADAADGRILAHGAEANRQRSYGADVVSRIEHGLRSEEARAAMQRLVREQVGRIVSDLIREAGGSPPERIHICGNPTMLHLWEGASVLGLSRMPFQPDFTEARETFLDAPDGSRFPARLLPGVSAFVGADLTAGIIACGMHAPAEHAELLIDIGTNGEIVLAAGGCLLATATAAGPAFEGVAISCGMAAVAGAVSRVDWDRGRFSLTTIGGSAPAGFCGSGLLDLLAALRCAGRLMESGALVGAGQNGERVFTVSSDPPLRITQSDIRALQLAKGAIAAGIRTLCRRAGVPLREVARVHLAGAFGSGLSPESALAVGLIPRELSGRIEAAGNTALAGTLLSARDPALMDELSKIAPEIGVLDLSREPGFQDAFIEAMRFPA